MKLCQQKCLSYFGLYLVVISAQGFVLKGLLALYSGITLGRLGGRYGMQEMEFR